MNKTKEMLLRMVMRCNKVRKHKPAKVESPELKIGSLPSNIFPESEIEHKEAYGRTQTREVRKSLRKLI